MKENKIPAREALLFLLFEAVLAALTVAVFILIGKFDYTVLLGAILGVAVTVGNFVFLSVSINRAIDKILDGVDLAELKKKKIPAASEEEQDSEDQGEGEDDEQDDEQDDEAQKFARENEAKLNAAVKLSYSIRSVSMIVALVLAFITNQFNPIAAAVPLLSWRAAISFVSLVQKKKEGSE